VIVDRIRRAVRAVTTKATCRGAARAAKRREDRELGARWRHAHEVGQARRRARLEALARAAQ
jgi:hypothetical protein